MLPSIQLIRYALATGLEHGSRVRRASCMGYADRAAVSPVATKWAPRESAKSSSASNLMCLLQAKSGLGVRPREHCARNSSNTCVQSLCLRHCCFPVWPVLSLLLIESLHKFESLYKGVSVLCMWNSSQNCAQ
jgi:hypothetical protein